MKQKPEDLNLQRLWFREFIKIMKNYENNQRVRFYGSWAGSTGKIIQWVSPESWDETLG